MKKILLLGFALVLVACGGRKSKEEIGVEKFYTSLAQSVENAATAHGLKANFEELASEGELYHTVEGLKDGIYEGRNNKDNYGYEHVIKVEVKDGKIISVDYDEVKGDSGKKSNENYWNDMGKDLSVVYKKYEDNLLTTQDTMEVDSVVGASYSLYRMRLAFSKAIEGNIN